MHLQGFRSVARRPSGVELLHDALGGDGSPAVDEQDRQQCLLSRAERDPATAVLDLHRSEDSDVHIAA